MCNLSRFVAAVRAVLVAGAARLARVASGSGAPAAGFDRTGPPLAARRSAPPGRAARLGLLLAPVVAAMALLGLGAVPAFADSCPNAVLRVSPSASLPDCRAYEQVSPVDKGDQEAASVTNFFDPSAAAGGDRAAWYSYGASSRAPAANQVYLATRGASGWSSAGIVPAASNVTEPQTVCPFPEYVAFTPELSIGILSVGSASQLQGCAADNPPLVAGEPRGSQSLFLRDNATADYRLIDVTPSNVTPADATFQGASPDLSHVVFDESAELTSDAASGDMLYEWADGTVSLVGQIPSSPDTSCTGSACTPVTATLGAHTFSTNGVITGFPDRVAHAVSDDGSRVFFTAAPSGSSQNLYLREGDTTTEVDASQGGPGASGKGVFQTASADGASVFFTDRNRLTADSSPAGADLYRYDTASGAVTDLTPDSADSGGAAVQGVVGSNDDASYLYFVANGVLAANANSHGDTAVDGRPNLYLRHSGATTFIATLDPGTPLVGLPGDSGDWLPGITACTGCTGLYSAARVSADGTHVAFSSVRSLTGYHNTPPDPSDCTGGAFKVPIACNEILLYDASTDKVACASCNPSGAAPLGPSQITGAKQRNEQISNNFSLTRFLSRDGSRLFFNSSDALLPGDTNGRQDVYEWEADGTGGCHSSADNGGCLYLISSGRGDSDALFFDASSSGNDVFFMTFQQLVGQDTDQLLDIYDARVDGGLESQNPPPPAPPCSSDACRASTGGSPSPPLAASVSFSGPGSAKPGSLPAQASVLTRTVRGASFVVKVRVPGTGRMAISGAGIKRATRSVAKAGTYRLRVRLTPKESKLLARTRKLRLTLRVRYTPAAGGATASAVRLTVRPAVSHRARQPRRAADAIGRAGE